MIHANPFNDGILPSEGRKTLIQGRAAPDPELQKRSNTGLCSPVLDSVRHNYLRFMSKLLGPLFLRQLRILRKYLGQRAILFH